MSWMVEMRNRGQLGENRGLTQHDTFTYAHLNYLSLYTSSMLVSFPSTFLLAKFEFEHELQPGIKENISCRHIPPPTSRRLRHHRIYKLYSTDRGLYKYEVFCNAFNVVNRHA